MGEGSDPMGPVEILASRFLLHPRDLDRSVAFYRDTLGLHPMREFGAGAGRGFVFFLGGGFLELAGRSDAAPAACTELWLQVRDVTALEARLAAADVPILESAVRKPWGLIELRAADPDGLMLVFVEVPPEHPLRRDHRSLPESD
jgi:catechol 2,3-dioxygenase-like lactoylglutathione lyase family enzyme